MEAINIVWFKKDLRLADHAPLYHAVQAGLPVLLMYCFEPSQTQHPTYSERHSWYAYHSLADMQQQLKPLGITLHLSQLEFTQVLETLLPHYQVHTVFAHRETAMLHTRQRNEAVAAFCSLNGITFQEFPATGVLPASQVDPPNWLQQWKTAIHAPIYTLNLGKITTPDLPKHIVQQLLPPTLPSLIGKSNKQFKPDKAWQKPGETNAHELLTNFILHKASNGYQKKRGLPHESATASSRLSAPLAFGNITIKQIYWQLKQLKLDSTHQHDLTIFKQQLIARDYALQMFEMNPQIEQQNLNYAVNGIRLKWNEALFEAFIQSKTGFPLVDAAMLCLQKTGFINHRLRALLASFVAHHLWLDWRKAAAPIAKLLVDFEPGIFYWNLQNLSSCTGLNPLNILLPAKEAKRIDKNGLFIKQWLPQFKLIPGALCGHPALLSDLEQQMYHFKPGKDYPLPIVNIAETELHAQTQLERIYQKPIAVKETAKLTAAILPLPAALQTRQKALGSKS